MELIDKPQLLLDKSRRQEIYDLRVVAYEKSPKSAYVNRQTFPNGWSDNLDERPATLHWIIEKDNQIIASARLAIVDNITEIKDLDNALSKYEIPSVRPLAYYSRLVVHPDYRKLGLVYLLDKIRIDYLKENRDIKFSIAWATPDRHQALTSFGFVPLGRFNFTWVEEFEKSLEVCFYIASY